MHVRLTLHMFKFKHSQFTVDRRWRKSHNIGLMPLQVVKCEHLKPKEIDNENENENKLITD